MKGDSVDTWIAIDNFLESHPILEAMLNRRFGFAARCEAVACPPFRLPPSIGLCPWSGLRPSRNEEFWN